MRTREDVKELAGQLDTTLKILDDRYLIFDGACALVAAIIAARLEKERIPYKTVLYLHPDGQFGNIQKTVKDGNLCHVAIDVLGQELGGEIDKQLMDEHGIKKGYTKMLDSKALMDLYTGVDNWNGEFDEKNTQEVVDEIELCLDMCL